MKELTIAGQENLDFFETLAKKQVKLWNDRSDIGIELDYIANYETDKGISTCKEAARDHLKALMDLYAYKIFRAKDRRSSVTTIFIPFKFNSDLADENGFSGYVGVNLHVSYSKSDNDHEYLCIVILPTSKTHAQANANGKLFKSPDVEQSNRNAMAAAKPIVMDLAEMEYDESAYLAEQARSNPNAWAEAVQANFEAKINNFVKSN